jgi:hypothetical protein
VWTGLKRTTTLINLVQDTPTPSVDDHHFVENQLYKRNASSWDMSLCLGFKFYTDRKLFNQKREKTTLVRGTRVNEGCITLVIAVSLYVNPKWVYGVGLWDIRYCLLLEVIPLDNHVQSWPKVGPFVGRGLYIRVLYILMWVPCGWVLSWQGV